MIGIAYDHMTIVKWWYLQVVFLFWFFGCYGGKRAKNSPKLQKVLSVALHFSGIIHHILVIYDTLVWNNDISRHFFHFFSILIFWVVRGVKGEKIVQDEKKLCLLHSISQETYIIWFSFMVHMCKMIMSVGIFLIFSKFLFSGLSVVSGQKITQNDKKLLCLISQEPYIIWSSFMVHMCNRIISPVFFKYIPNFYFGGQ